MSRDTFEQFQPPERGRFGDDERPPRRGPRVTGAFDLLDLTLTMHQEKPLAIAVTDPVRPTRKWIWLPKSQIEFEPRAGGHVLVTLPEWLAVSKGLV